MKQTPKQRRNRRKPSLLEPQAKGGETAELGFSFQQSVLLARLPLWLSYDGFEAMIRESVGDTEAKFFVPGYGFVRELLEAKNHEVGPAEFWKEIDRFRELDAGSPGTFGWFTLVSAGIAPSLRGLMNGLRRIRSPFDFYDFDSGIFQQSYQEYLRIVQRLGKSEDSARFLFGKVLIESDLSMAQRHGEILFVSSLTNHLPQYQNLRSPALKDIYNAVRFLIESRLNKPVTRSELEATITALLSSEERPSSVAIRMLTTTKQDQGSDFAGLRFDWTDFWGGDSRQYPPLVEWNERLMGSLLETRDWITRNRTDRLISLAGDRRLSAMIAIGAVFSAVAGFSVQTNHRGSDWSTSAYPDATTPPYPITVELSEAAGPNLVVTVGILRRVNDEVIPGLSSHGLNGASILQMHGDQPIVSPEQANELAQAIKAAVAGALVKTKSQRLHLFYAGPSYLALFLGHRLNATAPVQCYERVAVGEYVPTTRLFESSSES